MIKLSNDYDLFGDFIFLILGILFFIVGLRELIVFNITGILLGILFLLISSVCLTKADLF